MGAGQGLVSSSSMWGNVGAVLLRPSHTKALFDSEWRPNIPSMLKGVHTGTHDGEEFVDTGFDLILRESNKYELS